MRDKKATLLQSLDQIFKIVDAELDIVNCIAKCYASCYQRMTSRTVLDHIMASAVDMGHPDMIRMIKHMIEHGQELVRKDNEKLEREHEHG